MKKNIIRLKEKDLVKVVNRIVSEQIASTKPHVDDSMAFAPNDNPLASIKPPEQKPSLAQKMGNQPKVNGDIIAKKGAVRSSLDKVLIYLGDLIQASGINPETNNLVADIEKVKEKFENLFGEPTSEVEDTE